VYFLVRKQGEKGCRIHYNAVSDYARAEEKKAYLRDNSFTELKFETVHPDKNNNWLNLTENDWDEFIPFYEKDSRKSLFSFSTNGVVTARDEWVYDFDIENLAQKMSFMIDVYNNQVERLKSLATKPDIDKFVDYSIKWSAGLKGNLVSKKTAIFKRVKILRAFYKPYVSMCFYCDPIFSDRLTHRHYEIFGPNIDYYNLVILVNNQSAKFKSIVTDKIFEFGSMLDGGGQTVGFPLYRYATVGERVENITDWALEQFQNHYKDQKISKQDIFHYVYAVLHHPAYRQKYELNLKRKFPRIPFYEDFRKWSKWGNTLMDLHLNYENSKPYRLKREDKDPETVRKAVEPRLMARKEAGVIEVDMLTILRGVPAEAWEYRLGTYSALEWILERYKERKPKDPTIRDKFNTYRFAAYKEQVIDLLQRVCTVSVETMKIIRQMPS